MDEKSWKTWQSNQKIVMDEDLVQNDVMNEDLVQNGVVDGKIVKNFVMNAKIVPKFVMGLSIFKIGGWNSLQPIIKICWKNLLMKMNRGCCSEFQAEIHSW